MTARDKGPQPKTRLFVIVEPWGSFYVAYGLYRRSTRVQFWDPGPPLACKVTHADTSDRLISKGTPVATAYSVNQYDLPTRNRDNETNETPG